MYGLEQEPAMPDFTELGPRQQRSVIVMDEAKAMLNCAGWLAPCAFKPLAMTADPFVPAQPILPSAWTAIISRMRADVLSAKRASLPSNAAFSTARTDNVHHWNDVRIFVPRFLDTIEAQPETPNLTDTLIRSILKEYELNSEQERAFRIISDHASQKKKVAAPLLLYLGGMGGTGKSQVIKAVESYFNRRGEQYRFAIVAPTGSTAALLHGSTYHYLFGINSSTEDYQAFRNDAANLANVRDKIAGLDYIFLDEVSMLSCNALHDISTQLAKARDRHNIPFGGLSVILAGNFAQLPPTTGPPLYSGSIGTDLTASLTFNQQVNILGKILWHQFTTVVILRKNMRQKQASVQDTAFRQALTNMRYAACTTLDLQFLRSRIANSNSDGPCLNTPELRNVSVITAWNAHKDQMNRMGSDRFASDNNAELVNFYSVDKLRSVGARKNSSNRRPPTVLTAIDGDMQAVLWNSPPNTSQHFPGKLSLCVNMPVMIRYNYATELCMTKGQEEIVRGWTSSIGPSALPVLDILYVELSDPPRQIRFENLPDNVVPLVRQTRVVTCVLPTDEKVSVSRSQVDILPNFSMTDYGAQGKNWTYNVVDLNNCKNHQSYYTALSRGTTAHGTVLLQGFDERKITHGISGYLRQEFRELDLLDEITAARCAGTVPDNVEGTTRNQLIGSFKYWKKNGSETNQNTRPVQETVPEWRQLSRPRKPVVPSQATTNASDDTQKSVRAPTRTESKSTMMPPVGFPWDSANYSCGYDAVFTIFCNLWTENPESWDETFQRSTKYLGLLAEQFKEVVACRTSLGGARDVVRAALHAFQPLIFPYNHDGTAFVDLASALLPTTPFSMAKLKCLSCGVESASDYHAIQLCHSILPGFSTSDYWLSDYLTSLTCQQSSTACVHCGPSSSMWELSGFQYLPELFVVCSYDSHVNYDKSLTFSSCGLMRQIQLCGIVYLKDFHITARIVRRDGSIWYHDGITTGSNLLPDGHISSLPISNFLSGAKGKPAVGAIYCRTWP
ncbi:ATP-dependent DNA helicase PIF1 [Hypsizygus marmoreus]|uniref:ATP-dependent DNA helicase n=1 Tax=Hypsizygus marmoreus TaxID=39966 RepID=A0A369JTZ7_HYPMA|nr:ATP-dependent DNA helicase PIF1 [Hypsizygus marmoreus]